MVRYHKPNMPVDNDFVPTAPRTRKRQINQTLSAMFAEVAAVYVALGVDTFRTRAYENAAASISQASTSLETLWKEGRLEEVPGLGDKFIAYIDEYFKSGRIKHFERETAKVPAGFFSLLPVIGIGPKTAYQLAQTYQLEDAKTALVTVRHLAQAGNLQGLAGIQEAKQQQILEAIDDHLRKQDLATGDERLPYARAVEIAESVMKYIRQSPAVLEVVPLGSLRREAPTVGDIDLAVKTRDPVTVMEHVRQYPDVARMFVSGNTSTSFWHKDGVQVDVKTNEPESWGNMLQHFTGSKNFNIALRKKAIEQGKSMSEHGIVMPDGSVRRSETEEAVFAELGEAYVPPAKRS